jgi:hypothetical protein
VLAAAVGMALATAGPGVAANSLPFPEVPSPPTGAPGVDPTDPTQPPASESGLPDAIPTEPAITVDVDVDAGNLDVSVRVLSPGEDAPDAPQPPVISSSAESDTTADPTTASERADDASGDGAQEGSNTNVTVRVLSPGDNGPVDQGTRLEAAELAKEIAERDAGEAKAPDVPGSGTAPEAAEDSLISPKESEQYQQPDSRYQSDEQFADDPWTWLWYLSVDCDGNATSSSTEAGVQSSRDWTWNWTWEWACNSPPHPPPLDSLADEIDDQTTRAPPEGSAPTSTASADGAAAADAAAAPEPWLWTWTFTFCGETATATLPISPETELEWVWDWIWTWTCQDAVGTEPSESPSASSTGDPAPASSTEASGDSSGGSAAGSGAGTVGREVESLLAWITGIDLPAWVLPLAPPELGVAVVPGFGPLSDAVSTSTIGYGAVIPPPFAAPSEPISAIGATAVSDPTVISPGLPPQTQRPSSAATSPAANGGGLSGHPEPDTAEPRVVKASPRAKRQPPSRSGGAPLSPWRPLLPTQAAGGLGASSSFVPSASVVGTAALVALFVLAAPGFGRRIRVARELRPRGTYGSSIDHPG